MRIQNDKQLSAAERNTYSYSQIHNIYIPPILITGTKDNMKLMGKEREREKKSFPFTPNSKDSVLCIM